MVREAGEHVIKKVKFEHSVERITKALRCTEREGVFQTDEIVCKTCTEMRQHIEKIKRISKGCNAFIYLERQIELRNPPTNPLSNCSWHHQSIKVLLHTELSYLRVLLSKVVQVVITINWSSRGIWNLLTKASLAECINFYFRWQSSVHMTDKSKKMLVLLKVG